VSVGQPPGSAGFSDHQLGERLAQLMAAGRNDSHQGDPIVVINHQDGAISWIPGTIR